MTASSSAGNNAGIKTFVQKKLPAVPHLFLSFFLFPIAANTVVAQNLVPNPGFEAYHRCPGYYSLNPGEFWVVDWRSANAGTPDHFHACSHGEADVPHNWAGVSEPYEGNGYAGIYIWMAQKEYREYLQSKLLEPLVKDSLYIVEFHYKLSSYSRYSVDRIGLLLTTEEINQKNDGVLLAEPTLAVINDSALTKNTGYWEKARMTFRAKGGEQYLIIGNFWGAATRLYRIKFTPNQQPMLASASYYYIDAVSVVPKYSSLMQTLAGLTTQFGEEEVRPDKVYVLRNINFTFDSYKLLSSSFPELEKIVRWMEEHPNSKVLLTGHTDDVGGERYNNLLSLNRAKSVSAYLVSQGIRAERIQTAGLGKTKPLIESTTEEARSINRRVEVTFTGE